LLKLFISISLTLLALTVAAQEKPPPRISNLVGKFISCRQDTVVVDTLSIVPGSFSIKNLPDSAYILNVATAVLVWRQRPVVDSIWVRYRTFPYKLQSVAQQFSFDSVQNNFLQPFTFRTSAPGKSGLFDFGTIDYTGSFGRSISFGNAQDAVLNSNLNLQLSGLLADSIELSAAISDQNLPVQPDGSTSQLNEIDRIFIQFQKKNWRLNLGDIDLRQNNHYYLNFYKRLQGVAFETRQRISKNIQNSVLVSGAIAKGKFTTNVFQGQEGNQGPYRLQGANNEFFFIVLANSERIYIDGELMQRGEDQDYTINYNTAEVTFTPKRLITKDKRLRIEFEYSDRNYLNSQLYVTDQVSIGSKLNIRVSAFSNTDARNSPINQTLDDARKIFLGNIGDSVQRAFFPAVERDTLTPGKVLYKKIDTTYNSTTQTIYVFSTNPDSARFNLSFTEVGIGQGDYLPAFNGTNGKVFVWVQPVGGVKQGTHEPVQFLVAARQQQVVSVLGEYKTGAQSYVKAEAGMSKNDVNTFSKKDKDNDRGFGAKLQWVNHNALHKNRQLVTDVAWEANDRNLRTIERLRSPEFNRDWNLPLVPIFSNEQLTQASAELKDDKTNFVKLQTSRYVRDSAYLGFRQAIQSSLIWKDWLWTSQLSYTKTDSRRQQGVYIRPTTEISKLLRKFNNYRIGFQFFAEQNELLNKQPDTLDYLSIGFDSWKYYLNSREDRKNRWGLSYIARNNKIPVGRKLQLSDISKDISFTTELEANPRHQFRLNATYRNLEVKLPQRLPFKSDKTLLGRAEYNMRNQWKGLLNMTFLFEAGSGQEQQRDVAYLEVPAGQGEFYWIDYNGNGAQELNEFEQAQFPDQRKFIRIFTPTNRFVKANFSSFNYGATVNPRALMNKPGLKGFKNLLSRLYLQSSWQVSKKEQSADAVAVNPFKTDAANNALIAFGNTFSNSFSFNKFNTVWGVDLNQYQGSNKALLTYGYESRRLQSWTLRGRWNLQKKFLLEATGKKAVNELSTPSFNNRNYQIDEQKAELKAAYNYRTTFRLSVNYEFNDRRNLPLYGGEKAIINSAGAEVKYNVLQSAVINGKFTFSNINYTGATNTTVGFIMLDALQPGKNYLWNINLVKTLSNSLELTFNYEGRKTGLTRVIHIGGATLRATFF
jgi:hypothetical protein